MAADKLENAVYVAVYVEAERGVNAGAVNAVHASEVVLHSPDFWSQSVMRDMV